MQVPAEPAHGFQLADSWRNVVVEATSIRRHTGRSHPAQGHLQTMHDRCLGGHPTSLPHQPGRSIRIACAHE
jgi:hypothetical protein